MFTVTAFRWLASGSNGNTVAQPPPQNPPLCQALVEFACGFACGADLILRQRDGDRGVDAASFISALRLFGRSVAAAGCGLREFPQAEHSEELTTRRAWAALLRNHHEIEMSTVADELGRLASALSSFVDQHGTGNASRNQILDLHRQFAHAHG